MSNEDDFLDEALEEANRDLGLSEKLQQAQKQNEATPAPAASARTPVPEKKVSEKPAASTDPDQQLDELGDLLGGSLDAALSEAAKLFAGENEGNAEEILAKMLGSLMALDPEAAKALGQKPGETTAPAATTAPVAAPAPTVAPAPAPAAAAPAAPAAPQGLPDWATGGGLEKSIEEALGKLGAEEGAGSGGFPGGLFGAGELGGGLGQLFDDVMSQLFSKEVLYPPMLGLKNKFPGWLEENKGGISADEMAKYRQQEKIVFEICEVFEGLEDNTAPSAAVRNRIIQLMDKMQALGNPPVAMMKELSPDVEFGSDGTPNLPPSMDPRACNPS